MAAAVAGVATAAAVVAAVVVMEVVAAAVGVIEDSIQPQGQEAFSPGFLTNLPPHHC